MKLITFVVPCYNSQDYMSHCIDTLLSAGSDVEILVVNDGSSDNTGQIANDYEKQYPDIVKAIHQPNGGHGAGINTGLRYATGKYFKVVDSDDWVDEKALRTMIKRIKDFERNKVSIDLFISNYVYEYAANNSRHTIRYTGVYPVDTVFTWNDVRRFDPTRYMIMHSVTFRTQLLRDINLKLPEHTFYVDNIVVYTPLPYVKTMYYMNVDLYRYYIGRSDQSVNEKVMVSRVDQQIRITQILMEAHDMSKIYRQNIRLYKFMANYLSIMYTITNMLLAVDGSEKAVLKQKQLWDYTKKKDPVLYRKIKYRSLAFFMSFRGKIGRKTSVALYKITRHFYKFN